VHPQQSTWRDFHHLLSLPEWLFMCSVFEHSVHYPNKKKTGHLKASARTVCLHLYFAERGLSRGDSRSHIIRGKEMQWMTQPLSILRQAWNASGGWKTQDFLTAMWESTSSHPAFQGITWQKYSKGEETEVLHVGPQYLLASLWQE
jgi:hypothetical protein